MAVGIIRWDDHRLVPWRNGLGTTREIAMDTDPTDPEGRMLWRISIASVDQDGPFSDFIGYQRIIMLLSGEGMRLDFGRFGSTVLDRPFVPACFDGGWTTTATLLGGPVRDLNVMVADHAAAAGVDMLAAGETRRVIFEGNSHTFLHVLRGEADAEAGGGRHRLRTGDTLRVGWSELEGALSYLSDETLVCRIDIDDFTRPWISDLPEVGRAR